MVRCQPSYAHKPTTAGAHPYIQVRKANKSWFWVRVRSVRRSGRVEGERAKSLRRTGRRVTSPWASQKARAAVPQTEARGEHMSNHLGRLRHALSAPNCTRPQEAKRGTTQGGEPEPRAVHIFCPYCFPFFFGGRGLFYI